MIVTIQIYKSNDKLMLTLNRIIIITNTLLLSY